MDIKLIITTILIALICIPLNRFRGDATWMYKGFDPTGEKWLPGRAIFWTSPIMGVLALFLASWEVAIVTGASYFFWGLFSWGHIFGSLAGYSPNRPMTSLETFFLKHFSPAVGSFLRMMFVLPGVALVAWWSGQYLYLLMAPLFSFLGMVAFRYQINPLEADSWKNAELSVGGVWGVTIMAPLVLLSKPFISF